MSQNVRIQRSRAPIHLPTQRPVEAFSGTTAATNTPAGADASSAPAVGFNIGSIDIFPGEKASDRGTGARDPSADVTASHLQSLLRRSTAARGTTAINQVLGRAIVGSVGQSQGGTLADSHLLQAKPRIGLAGGPVDADLQTQIDANRGQGANLDDDTRSTMEGAFGHDFSKVRVHADGESQELNDHIGARAFTTGSDIFFRQGEYTPHSPNGQELLAHELTHVVQQGGMRSSGDMVVGPAGDTSEREADAAGAAVVSMIQNMPASAVLDPTVATVPIARDIAPGAQRAVIQRNPIAVWEGIEIALTAAIVGQEQYGVSEHGLHVTSLGAHRMNERGARPADNEYTAEVFTIDASNIIGIRHHAAFKAHWQGNKYGEIGAAHVKVENDHSEFLLSSLEMTFTPQENLPNVGDDAREWPIRFIYHGSYNPMGNGDYIIDGSFELNAFGRFQILKHEVIDHSLISRDDAGDFAVKGDNLAGGKAPPPRMSNTEGSPGDGKQAAPPGGTGPGGTGPGGPPTP